jgi:hypothetical protein
MNYSVFCLKIDASRLSKEKKDYCAGLFLEKKRFINAVIVSQALSAFDYKTKTVNVKKQETFEKRKITVISSTIRLSVRAEKGGRRHQTLKEKRERRSGMN